MKTWLHLLDSCPSTNTWALENLANLKHGDVVFTRNQTAGRGQQGRVWDSSTGVLTASFVFKAIANLSGLSLMAGLAIVYAIEELCPSLQDLIQLKWANDLILDHKKVAGILCESVSDRSSRSIVIGVGLNRRAQLQLPSATSLHDYLDQVPEELEILERSRHYLLQTIDLVNYLPNSLRSLLPAIRQRDFLLGKQITIQLGVETLTGQALGISDRGYLLLGLENGEVRSLSSGHIISISPDFLASPLVQGLSQKYN